MKGRLLSRDDYAALAMSGSLAAAARALAGYPSYASLFEGLGDNNLRRRDVERWLLAMRLDENARIYGFVTDYRLRAYLRAVLLRDEIKVIKSLLLALFDERLTEFSDADFSDAELTALLRSAYGLDAAALLASKTLVEFIASLPNETMRRVLGAKGGIDEGGLFGLEMRLDMYYFMNREAAGKRLDAENRRAANLINRTEADVMNIEWIYRLSTYYGMEPRRIYSCLLPIHGRLSPECLSRMAEAGGGDAFHAELAKTPYSRDFREGQPVERGVQSAMFRAYRTAAEHTQSLAGVLYFIHLKDREMKNLTSLFEGVRYGLTTDAIMGYIAI